MSFSSKLQQFFFRVMAACFAISRAKNQSLEVEEVLEPEYALEAVGASQGVDGMGVACTQEVARPTL